MLLSALDIDATDCPVTRATNDVSLLVLRLARFSGTSVNLTFSTSCERIRIAISLNIENEYGMRYSSSKIYPTSVLCRVTSKDYHLSRPVRSAGLFNTRGTTRVTDSDQVAPLIPFASARHERLVSKHELGLCSYMSRRSYTKLTHACEISSG